VPCYVRFAECRDGEHETWYLHTPTDDNMRLAVKLWESNGSECGYETDIILNGEECQWVRTEHETLPDHVAVALARRAMLG
jgi:hypothetical protein